MSILLGVAAALQFAATFLFLFRSRKLTEINWLPKTMTIMATVSATFNFVDYTLISLNPSHPLVIYNFYTRSVINITNILNYCLIFRFVRLQVQLMALKENSNKIMAAINRSKKIEYVVFADLLIYAIMYCLYQLSGV